MRRFVVAALVVAAILPVEVAAQETALGTLFFSAADRAALDRARRGESINPVENQAAINGYVKRSDGKTTVWVSGAAYPVAAALSERLRPSDVESANPVAIRSSDAVPPEHTPAKRRRAKHSAAAAIR